MKKKRLFCENLENNLTSIHFFMESFFDLLDLKVVKIDNHLNLLIHRY